MQFDGDDFRVHAGERAYVDLPADLDDRAALASVLSKVAWPTDAETIQARVRDTLGPDRLRNVVARLRKDRRYHSVAEVWAEITGEPPQQRS